MYEGNKIGYEDLFDPNLGQDIQKLVEQVENVGKTVTDMLKGIKAEAKGLEISLSANSSASKGGRDSTKNDAANVEKLYEAYQQLGSVSEYVNENLKKLLVTKEQQTKAAKLAQKALDSEADSITRIKAQLELAKMAYEGMNSAQRSQQTELLGTIKTLDAQVKNYTKSIKAQNAASQQSATTTSKQTSELLGLNDAYATLAPLVEQTGVNLSTLITTQKQQEQASRNGVAANTSLQGSYNQLYAQYNLIKLVLNSMGQEMRNDINIGKAWEAQALEIMNKMKAMQEATGKSTLSVGDYGKALNGLNLSTQQVLREVPTLANSLQQFFVAISNNVPIFIDNFKRASAELGGFTKAVGATLKVVFSWQTALLVLLTVLPRIAKAISDKKKAQEEANRVTEKTITLEEMLANAERDLEKAMVQASMKTVTLTRAIGDNSRSVEERSAAAKILKQDFEDELANFSEEEILAGKAKDALDKLTESVKAQAEARAILNKMTEYYGKILDNEPKKVEAQAEVEKAEAKVLAERLRLERDMAMTTYSNESNAGFGANVLFSDIALKNAESALEKAKGVLSSIEQESKDYGEAIEKLYEQLDITALVDKVKDGGKEIKEEVLSIPSYYNDMLQAIIDSADDGIAKELAQYDLSYKIQLEKRQAQMTALEELLTKATEEERAKIKEQMGWLSAQMIIEEDTYYKTRERMWQEHLNAFRNIDIEEETDWEEQERRNIETILRVDKRLRDKAAYEDYERGLTAIRNKEANAKTEKMLKEELNQTLLASEHKYWQDYLTQLREEGVLTVEEYNKIMENLTKAEPEKKRRRKSGVRNLVELGFALNPTTGEKENGMLKVKDEYKDFADAVNEALSLSIQYMDEWMDKRIEMAEVAVEQAEKEANAAKTALDYEMQARANGYANNVQLARKEYEEKLAMEKQAIAERQRLEKIQESINTAQQIGSLVTATANLWSGYSEIPIVGPALAIAATALMWGSFIAAKVQAANLANQKTYGQGMEEYIDYGGSHASGHDVDFGRDKNGVQRKVERGEVIGVIRKDKVQKYGVDGVLNILRSLNNGTFEKDYVSPRELETSVFGETPESRANSLFLNAKVEDMLRNAESGAMGLKTAFMGGLDFNGMEANYEMAFSGNTDLSSVEAGIETLIKQNDVRVVPTSFGRIEYRGKNKRIIRDA